MKLQSFIILTSYLFSFFTGTSQINNLSKTVKNSIDSTYTSLIKKNKVIGTSIAIVDNGANLILFRRQNDAFLGSIDIAISKAKSSASFPFPTRLIAEIVYGKDGKPGRVPGLAHSKDVVAFAGGLPITSKDGVLLGAIGVSGASADEDEICAQAAIDAVASELE